MTRQRIWQLKMMSAGCCILCGAKAVTRMFCELHRQAQSQRIKKWQLGNPDKKAAHLAVNNAIARGDLVRPSACSSCRRERRVQGHHADYDKPLEVIWLCSECHSVETKAPVFAARLRRFRLRRAQARGKKVA